MKVKSIVLAVASALMLTACGSVSTLKSSWIKDKYVPKQDPVKKVLIVAIAKDESVRRKVEDDMKATLYGKGADIETSYPFIKYGTDTENLVKLIELENFTHIIAMRIANIEKELQYRPGNYYGGGYYGGYYPAYYRTYGGYFNTYWYGSGYYEPGRYEESVEYTIETNVYSIKEKEMVYSALTSTFKGSGLDQTVFATLESVAKDLKKRQIIQKK